MKVLRFIRNNILIFMLGIIVGSVAIVLATETIAANIVTYDNTVSHASATNVKTALDELYNGMYNLAATAGGGMELVFNKPNGLSTTLIAELYRYQGTTADNYICFGTTSKNTCTGDTDKYMYRIIGINQTGQMKLIKKEALEDSFVGGTGTWPNSTLKTGLNGSYFLTNTTYVPSGWEDRIAFTNWHYGQLSSNDFVATNTAAAMATAELGAATDNSKIALMYVHDYLYSNYYEECQNNNECRNTWLYLGNNDTTYLPDNSWSEWVLLRSTNTNYGWVTNNSGNFGKSTYYIAYTSLVRPVFFLASGEEIASGTGTLEDPYILA